MKLGGISWEHSQLEKKHPGAIEAVYRAVQEYGSLSSRELEELEVISKPVGA